MTDTDTDRSTDTSTGTDAAPASRCPVSHYPFDRPSAVRIPPVYDELLAGCPVARVTLPSGDDGYVVSRYEDVRTLLADLRFSRAATAAPDAPRLYSARPDAGGLFTMDPPEHTRLKRLVAREFTARRVERLRPRLQETADRLLDAMESPDRTADLVEAFAMPLPVVAICELLGVPYEDRETFLKLSGGIVSITSLSEEQALNDKIGLAVYFSELIARKRAEPGQDLLSALIQAHDEEGSLSQDELIIMGMTILIAGHETTASVLGTGALALLRRPEIVARLAAEPELINPVVEEIVRTNPIGDGGPLRVTLEDVEIAGTVIPRNSAVIAAIPPVNHDGTVFDRPYEFDITRDPNPHLAFGHGFHYCLGAALARAELQIGLGTLFRRHPGLRLTVPVEELRLTTGSLTHSLVELPVAW